MVRRMPQSIAMPRFVLRLSDLVVATTLPAADSVIATPVRLGIVDKNFTHEEPFLWAMGNNAGRDRRPVVGCPVRSVY
jgi:hypothetical protein